MSLQLFNCAHLWRTRAQPTFRSSLPVVLRILKSEFHTVQRFQVLTFQAVVDSLLIIGYDTASTNLKTTLSKTYKTDGEQPELKIGLVKHLQTDLKKKSQIGSFNS